MVFHRLSREARSTSSFFFFSWERACSYCLELLFWAEHGLGKTAIPTHSSTRRTNRIPFLAIGRQSDHLRGSGSTERVVSILSFSAGPADLSLVLVVTCRSLLLFQLSDVTCGRLVFRLLLAYLTYYFPFFHRYYLSNSLFFLLLLFCIKICID
jgi:hypothetical protein